MPSGWDSPCPTDTPACPRECEALVTLREGKYHQIKRMCAARGKPVVFLKRLTFGTLTLDETLAPGEWRELTEEEKKGLQGCHAPQ